MGLMGRVGAGVMVLDCVQLAACSVGRVCSGVSSLFDVYFY